MTRDRVVILPRARADTPANFRGKVEQSPQTAARWLTGLQKAVAKLADNPLRHRVAVEESARFGLEIRQCLDGKRSGVSRILFSLEQETISVLAIRHSAQDIIEP